MAKNTSNGAPMTLCIYCGDCYSNEEIICPNCLNNEPPKVVLIDF